ncbi:hypothetical protein RUM44_009148 [Polyplax serrata]|uniref:TFIIS N-terminal domain-containing protein n=1 Tax=Polyplax serrata TaxID=468196 RepID=A0ABR1ATK7_POLSC
MACNDIVSAILHYKRNIDKISDPPERALKYEDRLLHCINKLYKLPVNVNHLQETGVGRTVNSLRKIEGEKGLGDAAKALVAKWKTMVMLEDEAERKQMEECAGPSEEDLNRIKLIRESEKSEQKKTETSLISVSVRTHVESQKLKNHEDSKKHRNTIVETSKSSRKRKHESDGNEKYQSKRRETNDENDSNNLVKSCNERVEPKDVRGKSKTSSSVSQSYSNKESNNSQHKSTSSSSSSTSRNYESPLSKSKDSKKRNKDYVEEKKSSSTKSSSDTASRKHHSSSHKFDSKSKKKVKDYAENDGFDSQSGASFADALGSIVKKSPKKKSNTGSTISSPTSYDHSSDNGVSNVKEKIKDVKEMLFSQPKLEPLEPDLVATLPTPTPYYRPHPSYIPTQEAVRRRVQAEEDALTTIMSNKNTRTKVYSGVKGGLSYVPSLYECCCRVLQQHIDALEYTGGIPFSLLKPVLEGATPSQLYQFEHFNPYIIEETDDLWKFHVNKEFRSEKRQEYESWRDMYLRCVDEREEKYKAVTANIIQRTIENSVPVRKAKLAYIDVAKPPRNILKKQIKNGTAKPDSARLLGKNDPEAVKVSAPKQPITKEPSTFRVKPKVAPLMQKTLKSIKMSRFKR